MLRPRLFRAPADFLHRDFVGRRDHLVGKVTGFLEGREDRMAAMDAFAKDLQHATAIAAPQRLGLLGQRCVALGQVSRFGGDRGLVRSFLRPAAACRPSLSTGSRLAGRACDRLQVLNVGGVADEMLGYEGAVLDQVAHAAHQLRLLFKLGQQCRHGDDFVDEVLEMVAAPADGQR